MKNTFLLTISFLLPLYLSAQAQRYYVDQLAFGQNNGQSWTDAFQNLHDALALAEAGDEIWVAKGHYRPSATTDRTARFQLLSGVRLYGGFAGTELDLSERDWTGTPTVLDGDIGTLGDSTDNSYNLLYLYRPDSLTLVDGFTFRHALANDSFALPGEPGTSGAALYIMAFDGEAYPTIRHCIFAENASLQHGGAVYIEGGGSGSVAPVFEQCHFTANRAIRGNGGALYRNGGSWVDRPVDIESCTFEQNIAYRYGGAIFFTDSPRSDTFDIHHSLLRHNRLSITGFVTPEGASIQLNLPRSNGATILSLVGCELSDHPRIGGSAIGLSLSFNFETGNLVLDIDSCTFKRNGSVSYTENLGSFQAFVKNSYFQEDTIAIQNYAPFMDYPKSLLYNLTVDRCENFAFDNIYDKIDKIFWSNCGGQNRITNYGSYPLNITHLVTHNTYFHYSGGISIKISNSTWNGDVTINNKKTELSNNIISIPDSIGIFYMYPLDSAHIFHHNLINRPDTLPYSNSWVKANNLWATDPQFMQPDSGDFRLQPCSPAIDAGTNTAVTIATDAAGQPRIQGGTVDMGAYEAPAFGLTAAPTIKPACDSTANGAITAPLAGVCAPLSVAWQSGSQSGTTLDHLVPGLYQVTLTDAQGRSLHFDTQVPVGLPPVLYVQGSPISCFGANDGQLTVQPLTGQPPFNYQWSPPVTTDSIATSMPPGPASVTVTDAWGCSSAFNFQVPEPDTLQFTATVQDASGAQSANGSIQVSTVTGGTAPYDYLWSPGGSMETTLGNLTPGLYTLTVTDVRGCESAWTFEVRYVSGTDEAAGQAMLLIYPSPATESATISGDFPDQKPTVLELYNAAGRLIRSWPLPDGEAATGWTLPLAELAAGQYVAQMKDAAGRVVGLGRLIKI